MGERDTERRNEPPSVALTEDTQSLLRELVDSGKRRSHMLRIVLTVNVILAAAVLIVLIVLVPRTLSVISDAENTLNSVNELIVDTESVVEGADVIIQDAEKILEENAEGLEEAVNNFNSVDFDSLNEAISDLADAVGLLANLSRIFG